MENFSRDLLLKKLRDRLNSEKIKLWLPPFTTEDKQKGEIPESLITKVFGDFNFTRDEIALGLEELRIHAVTKLQEREKFHNLGVATLKVKLTGASPSTSSGAQQVIPVECSLDITGNDFRNCIAAKFDVLPTLLKLICKGRVIDDNISLQQQNIQNGADVMAMFMTSSEAKIVESEANILEVEKTRRAAEILSSRAEEDDDDFDIQIADQNGQPLVLPLDEKKALTLAMTLHEKGRAALKNKRVSLALPLFLEADAEFSKCRSQILNSVDNYAILCLDIVWCYLLLKNLEQLPDAETRLASSESCFKRCYGEKMERLTAIKGGTGMEQVLFMRLYLLQGIVDFHKGEFNSAQNLFRRAEFVLNLLHVDEIKLQEIMLMGFTEREARLGLRAKNGNIQQAVEYIMEKKAEEIEVNQRAKKEWRQRVRSKRLGRTAGGEPVNVRHYDTLVDMEFPSGAAAEALRQANNDINQAIEILNTKPELFHLPDPEKMKFEITEDMVTQLCSLGFDLEVAKSALHKYKGNISQAVEELLRHNGHLSSPSASISSWSDSSISSMASIGSSESGASTNDSPKKPLGKNEKEELNNLVSDISTDANDHLDLTLQEEKEILQIYLSMIDNKPS
ncbi:NEDD8 ultimate buster 1-like isoform X2 [Physella acuta]|nr:NEDD8 ultimate buster 1-like isoform X2 [Physella acuta]XP_059173067.1 NEDD8 ultimate buster 1-like isoform X2 [Physella acuta]XP_059173068.1 NEDD8 ultimate buster 1-like isoform X2 [Physella acuta]XP_059173069.1 NEDD8 ultimate buster 1-like isoform X2 [Physella acuta]